MSNNPEIYFSVRSLTDSGLFEEEARRYFATCAKVCSVKQKPIGKHDRLTRAIEAHDAIEKLEKAIEDAGYSHREKIGVVNKRKVIGYLKKLIGEDYGL
jgi:hypothetical protein